MSTVEPIGPRLTGAFSQLSTRYDAERQIMWCHMAPEQRPCFTPSLLGELRRCQDMIQRHTGARRDARDNAIQYVVLGSKTPDVFSLGGDLALFVELIGNGARDALYEYARKSIDVLYLNSIDYHLPLTTIALLEGDAIGAGFEAALSCDVIIAERRSRMGFPEVLFNMFPGMGAYSFLARRLEPARVERMIRDGALYTAEEMHALGVVDLLVEDGAGETAVDTYLRQTGRSQNTHRALHRVRRCVNPVSYKELDDIAKIWVDAAMELSARDLRTMQRLVRAQDKRTARTETTAAESMEGSA